MEGNKYLGKRPSDVVVRLDPRNSYKVFVLKLRVSPPSATTPKKQKTAPQSLPLPNTQVKRAKSARVIEVSTGRFICSLCCSSRLSISPSVAPPVPPTTPPVPTASRSAPSAPPIYSLFRPPDPLDLPPDLPKLLDRRSLPPRLLLPLALLHALVFSASFELSPQ